MRLMKFALMATAVSCMVGTSVFAADLGINTPLGGVNVGLPSLAAPAAAPVMLSPSDTVYTDGVPRILSQPAVIDSTAVAAPAEVCRRGRTFFDLQLMGLDLLRLRGPRQCEAVQSLPAVIDNGACLSQPAVVEQQQCQPAVVPAPQPESKTVTLHDTITTTTTTRLYRVMRHTAARVYKRKARKSCGSYLPESGS